MAITFADKNRLAPVGAVEGQIRADDINELKREINTIDALLTGSTISVQSKSDFPAAVAGVITLDGSKTYRIGGNINLGTDRIVTSGARLIGSVSAPNTLTSTLTYTGTGVMITADGVDFVTGGLIYSCINGTFLDFLTGAGSKYLKMFDCKVDSNTLGSIDNPHDAYIIYCELEAITNGFTVSGANIVEFKVDNTECDEIGGTAFDLGTSIIGKARFNACDSVLGNGEFFISGLAAGANFTNRLFISLCSFTVSGTGAVLENITVNDVNVATTDNEGLQDSHHTVVLYVARGDEVDTVIAGGSGDSGNPIPILGTFTVHKKNRFTANAAGLATYHNGAESKTFRVHAVLNGAPVTGVNIPYAIYLAKNGAIDLSSRDQKTCSSSSPQKIVCVTEMDLTDSDTVQIYVENLSNTANFVTDSIKLVID
jgi:hypothetical protein